MARLRTIKPEFWTDERVGECSPMARLVFIASWNFSDDHGGLDRSAKQLKAQAFPYDDIDTEPLIQELIGAGLFVEYVVAGRMYLHINGFQKHQKIEKRSLPRIPVYEGKGNSIQPLPNPSPNPRGSSLGSGDESSGDETSGVYEAHTNGEHPNGKWTDDLQATYPRTTNPVNWTKALKQAADLVSDGETTREALAAAVRRYRSYVDNGGVSGPGYVMAPQNFLTRTKRDEPAPWSLAWVPPPTKAQAAQDANIDAGRKWLERGTA